MSACVTEEAFNFYLFQGLCKFGLYEVFKVIYSDMLGEENFYVYRTWVYLAASASAEFFADIGLSPMESAKVSSLYKWCTRSDTYLY